MRDEKLRLLALCGYPSDVRPTHQPFVRAVLRSLAAQGAEPTVLAPESRWARRRAPRFEVREGLPVHRTAAENLLARGLPESSLYLSMERNMQCGVGRCGHCQFGGAFICGDGPVFNWGEVKALLAHRGF